MKPTILVLHGPNLNMLGQREPSIYGTESLEDINHHLETVANELDCVVTTFQSNAEHCLVDRIQQAAKDTTQAIIFNPAAFTHTSIALRDAILAANKPLIEVHLSNIQQREPFRHRSYFSDIAIGTITGFGAHGYLYALRHIYNYLTQQQ